MYNVDIITHTHLYGKSMTKAQIFLRQTFRVQNGDESCILLAAMKQTPNISNTRPAVPLSAIFTP